MKNPKTKVEWQEAVDAAYGMLCLDSARQYGLIKGGPLVNVERCQELLHRGMKVGVKPAENSIERLAIELM
jgi:hypothetical protein